MNLETRKEREARIVHLVESAQSLASDDNLRQALVRSTGLSEGGIRLGFEHSLEKLTELDIDAIFAHASDVASVHVILSANVFVAPLRALVIALASSNRVSVHPSTREPHFTEALVKQAQLDEIALLGEKNVAQIADGEIHIYGKDETIAHIREESHVPVRGHGTGFGVAVVDQSSSHAMTSHLLARDIALFDQRGCLSPRVAFVIGDVPFANAFAQSLDESLTELSKSAPRGSLSAEERADVQRFLDSNAFAGHLIESEHHSIGTLDRPNAITLSPTGRHVQLVRVATIGEAKRLLTPLERYVTTIGASDPLGWAFTVSHARVCENGEMQSPPLDGPVDRR